MTLYVFNIYTLFTSRPVVSWTHHTAVPVRCNQSNTNHISNSVKQDDRHFAWWTWTQHTQSFQLDTSCFRHWNRASEKRAQPVSPDQCPVDDVRLHLQLLVKTDSPIPGENQAEHGSISAPFRSFRQFLQWFFPCPECKQSFPPCEVWPFLYSHM